MKKKLLTAAVLGALTLSATSVFASPITFSGDGYLQYNNTQQAPSTPFSWSPYNGIDARFRLSADGDIDSNIHAHARLVHEGDLSTSYASGKQLKFDQAYIAGKFNNVNIQVGKDDVATGKSLIMDDHGFSGIKFKRVQSECPLSFN